LAQAILAQAFWLKLGLAQVLDTKHHCINRYHMVPTTFLFLALASCPISIVALRVTEHVATDKGYVDVSKCEKVANEQMWGVWIDGRSATKGKDAYGKGYHRAVMSSLQSVYQLVPDGADANLDIYLQVMRNLQQSWRSFPNPIRKEIKQCHEDAMPEDTIRKIMTTVQVVDADYLPEEPMTAQGYGNMLTKLFADYASEVSGYPGRESELFSMAKLLQNMAFLHPLGDQNGRSRLALLQYMLRQRKLGCGTMMHNNNKNIYFETASNYAKSLDEGIKIYETASKTGFLINPWQTEEVQTSHAILFPQPQYMHKLHDCWQTMQNAGNKGTTVEMTAGQQ